MYPLPRDYESLSGEGQHLARINAVCLRETAEDLVTAWSFFRRAYLMVTPPGFFYGADLVESPPLHYQMVRDLFTHQFNAYACPRGAGKSTLVDEILLMLSLTQPGFPSGLCLASDNLIGERFDIYQKQFTENEFIIADFGELKPNKGEGKFNQHLLSLRNGSRIKGFVVLGRKRGTRPRPRLLVLDDPEYDPTSTTDTTKLRTDFEWLLFRVLMNMGEKGMNMFWPGTMITKRGSLWAACQGDDPRFRNWNRHVVGATYLDEHQQEQATWPQMWSMGELRTKQDQIGDAAYAAEYMNRPGLGVDSTFTIDPELEYYYVEGDTKPSPLLSTAKLRYTTKGKGENGAVTKHETVFGEWVGKMTRIMTVDYAPTVNRQSDFSCVAVMGFERPGDILWLLDLFLAKVKDDALIRKLYQMGQQWLPRVVGVEAVSIQRRLSDAVESFIQDRAVDGAWLPKVFPIRYPYGLSKQDRIGGMQWRFTMHRIKLPGHLRGVSPWNALYQQIAEFQADAVDGNLQHDDAIDTVAMYQEIARSRAGATAPVAVASTPIEQLKAGLLINPRTGLSNLSGVNTSDIPLDVVQKLIWDAAGGTDHQASLGMNFLKGQEHVLD